MKRKQVIENSENKKICVGTNNKRSSFGLCCRDEEEAKKFDYVPHEKIIEIYKIFEKNGFDPWDFKLITRDRIFQQNILPNNIPGDIFASCYAQKGFIAEPDKY